MYSTNAKIVKAGGEKPDEFEQSISQVTTTTERCSWCVSRVGLFGPYCILISHFGLYRNSLLILHIHVHVNFLLVHSPLISEYRLPSLSLRPLVYLSHYLNYEIRGVPFEK